MDLDDLKQKYIDNGLLDESIIITDEIDENDIDFENIVGIHQLFDQDTHYLLGAKGQKEYKSILNKYLIDNRDLFVYSNIRSNRLYFECVFGSKGEEKKKYRLEKLLVDIGEEKCPRCSSNLEVELKNIVSVKYDGVTVPCQKFFVYCPNCDTILGSIGFRIGDILSSIYFGGIRFIHSLESLKFSTIDTGEGNFEIKMASNFDFIYRC